MNRGRKAHVCDAHAGICSSPAAVVDSAREDVPCSSVLGAAAAAAPAAWPAASAGARRSPASIQATEQDDR